MIVRIFNAGISNGESPVRYLLSDSDHTGKSRDVEPQVLAGNPDTTIAVINNIRRKHKYVSGAIAFRDTENPSHQQMMQIIRSFKDTFCPGLTGDHFNSLFVLHKDKGNTEIHFVVPMTVMSGKRLNIHPPGARNIQLYEAFTRVTNQELGYEQVVPDPLKLALSDFERRAEEGQRDLSNKLHLHVRLRQAIRSGKINNREQLCSCLKDEFGVEVTRQGKDYISVKFPGAEKAKRFRGPLYNENSDYTNLLLLSVKNSQPKYLNNLAYQHEKAKLGLLIDERRKLYTAAYLQLPKLRITKRLQTNFPATGNRPAEEKNLTIKTKEINTMKPELATMKLIIRQALQLAGFLRTTRTRPQAVVNKSNVMNKIRGIRDKASNSANKDVQERGSMDAINDIVNAIGELQSDINGAIADITHAKTPEQRGNAERRLTKLMAQKSKLETQLIQAKVRQLNQVKLGI
jgi:hypothetical protein